MKRKTLVIALIVAVFILSGAMTYLIKTRNKPHSKTPVPAVTQQPVVAETTITAPARYKNTTLYQSQKYNFEFQYPSNLMVTSSSSEDEIAISNEPDGHWMYGVIIETNTDNLTLDQIVEKKTKAKTAGTEVPSKATVSDVVIDGQPAKLYSISNYGDYGNAAVVLLSGSNIINITGDTSNKTDFNLIASSFKFTTNGWKKFNSNGRFTRNNFSFSISYPSDWKYSDDSVFSDATGKIAEFAPGIIVIKPGQECFDAQKTPEGFKLVSQTNINIGNRPGALRISKSSAQYSNEFCLLDADKAFIMAFYEEKPTEANKKLFEKIMSTLEFIKQTP